jgi:hypothetical protein
MDLHVFLGTSYKFTLWSKLSRSQNVRIKKYQKNTIKIFREINGIL